MKVILLGDTHLGARGGADNFSDYFGKFFSDVLYPFMSSNGIDTVYQLGDLWDNRTALPLKAYHSALQMVSQPLVDNGYTMHVLLGNHDITLRESLKINTPESALKDYITSGHVVVYKEPTLVHVDENCTFDIIPWICKENAVAVSDFMKRKEIGDICLGHFPIEGASMYVGIPAQGGLKAEVFERYERVFTGHYHTRSELMDGKIQYVGTPYEITWLDAHDPRGFTVFDTITRKFEFVQNPFTLHQKIIYRDDAPVPQGLEGKYVKLIVEQKEDVKKFDAFKNSIELQRPKDVSVFEDLSGWTRGDLGDEDDDVLEVGDTLAVISRYIDSLETELPREKLKAYINGIYSEALST